MQWIERITKNIFPLSFNKQDIRAALDEWEYRGEMNDQIEPNSICELCDHSYIRFQFEIVNKNNSNNLLIGSECITKFGVKVFDEMGNLLDGVHAKDKVAKDRRKLVVEAKIKNMFNSILALCKIQEEKLNFENFINDYQKRGAFTPKQLSTLFWRLENNKIPHVKTDFKLYITKPSYKQQLLGMKDWELKRLWPALSLPQRKLLKNKFNIK